LASVCGDCCSVFTKKGMNGCTLGSSFLYKSWMTYMAVSRWCGLSTSSSNIRQRAAATRKWSARTKVLWNVPAAASKGAALRISRSCADSFCVSMTRGR